MNNSHLYEKLVKTVMSERQAKVYLALLKRGNATTADLQKNSGIPQTKIYEIVRHLVGKGYCSERNVGRLKIFEATDPRIAFVPDLDQIESRMNEINSLKEGLYDLYSRAGESAEPLEYIEVLRGNDVVHHQYCQLVKCAEKELLGFGKRPYACNTEAKSKEQDSEVSGILTRGGSVRWVYEFKLPEDVWILRDIKELQAKGVGIRVAESLPLKMMVFDKEKLLVAEAEDAALSDVLTMSVIKQKTIIGAFHALFEYFWNQSLELDVWVKNQFRNEAVKAESAPVLTTNLDSES